MKNRSLRFIYSIRRPQNHNTFWGNKSPQQILKDIDALMTSFMDKFGRPTPNMAWVDPEVYWRLRSNPQYVPMTEQHPQDDQDQDKA